MTELSEIKESLQKVQRGLKLNGQAGELLQNEFDEQVIRLGLVKLQNRLERKIKADFKGPPFYSPWWMEDQETGGTKTTRVQAGNHPCRASD